MFFFLVEEESEAGQESQPVPACEPGLGDLSKLTAPAYFHGVKLMFSGVLKSGHVQKIRFTGVKIFRSYFSLFFMEPYYWTEAITIQKSTHLQKKFQLNFLGCGCR